MRKSCLTQIIILAVIIFVLGMAVRQAIHRGGQAASAPTTLAVTPTLAPAVAAALDGAPGARSLATPVASTAPAVPLTLASSRPVMLAEGYAVSLAADAGWLYLAAQREPGPGVLVARVALADYSLVAQRDLSHASEHRLGGIALQGGRLWVVLQDRTLPNASLVLELDAASLDTRGSIPIPEAVTALAVAPDGAFYAARCAPGELLRLTAAGNVEQRAPSLEGTCYHDLAWVGGTLAGVASDANVLDIYDPATLALLARHALPFVSAQGNPVAGNALAYDGAHFFFAPDRRANPMIMAYQPRDGLLEAVIPSALP